LILPVPPPFLPPCHLLLPPIPSSLSNVIKLVVVLVLPPLGRLDGRLRGSLIVDVLVELVAALDLGLYEGARQLVKRVQDQGGQGLIVGEQGVDQGDHDEQDGQHRGKGDAQREEGEGPSLGIDLGFVPPTQSVKGKEEGGLPVGKKEEKILLELSDWHCTIELLWIELEVIEGNYNVLQVHSLHL